MKKLENGNFELSREELIGFLAADHELRALQFGGVDNWDWRDESLDNYLSSNDSESFTELAEKDVDSIE